MMDAFAAAKVLLRRWPIVLVVLALTGVGIMFGGKQVKPDYETSATLLLLSPGAPGINNPYLEFGGNLEVTANALRLVVMSDAGVEALTKAGATGTFDVVQSVSGPILEISAVGATAEEAVTTARVVLDGLTDELTRRQDEIAADPTKRITANVLTPPSEALVRYGSRIRVMAAIGLVGLAAAAGLSFLVEAASTRRAAVLPATPTPSRKRRDEDGREDDVDDDEDEDDNVTEVLGRTATAGGRPRMVRNSRRLTNHRAS